MSIETWEVPFEAYSGDDPYIFVSYAHRDHEIVFTDLITLHHRGYRMWYDEGIDPGNEWAEEVAEALRSCTVFLVFLTENAVSSANVQDEISFALDHKKRFLAVHVAPTRLPPGVDLRTRRIQAIMRYRTSSDMYLRKLESALSGDRAGSVRSHPPGATAAPALSASRMPHDAERLHSRIASFHRTCDWEDIKKLASQATQARLDVLASSGQRVPEAIKLSDLAAFLTDADATDSARRCLDAAIDALLVETEATGERLEVLDALGMAYNNMGRLLRRHNSSSRSAESFYRKSLEAFQALYPVMSHDVDLGDRLGMAFTNLGNALNAQGKLQASKHAYQGALNMYEHLSSTDPTNIHLKSRLGAAKEDTERAAAAEKNTAQGISGGRRS